MLMVDTDLVYTQFFHQETYGELNPALDVLIRENADWVDLRLFLMPYAFADDGTRFRTEHAARLTAVERLKALYAHYGRELVVIDGTGPERMKRLR